MTAIATDWTPFTISEVSHSPSLHAYRTPLKLTVPCIRFVNLLNDEDVVHQIFPVCSPTDVSPLLAEVTYALWAQNKHDVGLKTEYLLQSHLNLIIDLW